MIWLCGLFKYVENEYLCSQISPNYPMKKELLLFLFVATATFAQAQVSKMLGQWDTFDDKTGDMRGTVRIYEVSNGFEEQTAALNKRLEI